MMSHTQFQMVRDHDKEYPNDVPLDICELVAHIDIDKIATDVGNYSLHTEYSYGKRNFSSTALEGLKEISDANRNGIPQLWKNKRWAEQFAEFIKRLSGTNNSVRHRDKDFGLVYAVYDDVECDEIVTVEKVEFGKIAFFGFARVGNCVFHRVHLRVLILPFGKSGGAQAEKNENCVFLPRQSTEKSGNC